MKDKVIIQMCFHPRGFNITNMKRGNNMRDTICGWWVILGMYELNIVASRSVHRTGKPRSSEQHHDGKERRHQRWLCLIQSAVGYQRGLVVKRVIVRLNLSPRLLKRNSFLKYRVPPIQRL